jgi:hypothetical protein
MPIENYIRTRKPLDGLSDGPGEHILDDAAIAEEVGGSHPFVRDVASTAARYKDLRPQCLRTVEENYPPASFALACSNRRGKTGSSASDDHEIRPVHRAHYTRIL